MLIIYNLIIIVIFYPVLAHLCIPAIKKTTAGILLGLCLLSGLAFTWLSTYCGLSFENNLIDIIAINLFLFSIFGFTTWVFRHFTSIKKWLYFVCLILLSIIAFILFLNAFGPSEAYGQRSPENIQYVGKEYKITHTGYSYGWMDYGSRFILYRTHSGIERIVGIAANTDIYYNHKKGLKFRINPKNNFLIINYIDDRNIQKIDSLYFWPQN